MGHDKIMNRLCCATIALLLTCWTQAQVHLPASAIATGGGTSTTTGVTMKATVGQSVIGRSNDGTTFGKFGFVHTGLAAGSITVDSPNGDENWPTNLVRTITWTSTQVTNVRIEVSTNNGDDWTEIIASTDASAGSFAWTVTGDLTDMALIRITDVANSSVSDQSDAPFNIIDGASALIFVDDSATGGANDGSSWANAFTDLQDALLVAGSGGEIWVAAGTYRPGSLRTDSFELKDDVAIYGGFAGMESSVAERIISPPTGAGPAILAGETVLSGDLANNDSGDVLERFDIVENTPHVVIADDVGETAVLDGFTITGGNSEGSPNGDRGGGFYNHSATPGGDGPTVRNCVFIFNRSGTQGGAAYLHFAGGSFTDCRFETNLTPNFGAGVYNHGSTTSFTRVFFDTNIASGGGAARTAGAAYHTDANATSVYEDCLFGGNQAVNGGGVFVTAGAQPVFNRCTFNSNHAVNGDGGAIHVDSGGAPTITNSLFVLNRAIIGTVGGSGGAIFAAADGNPTVINCTFFQNTAVIDGGAFIGGGAGTSITNSIFWANAADGVGDQIQTTQSVSFSIVQGGFPAGSNIIDADPQFVDDTDPDGGDNILGTADDGLRVMSGSPAIDSGVAAGTPADDILGNPRTAGLAKDIGAFEFEGSPSLGDFVWHDTNGDGIQDEGEPGLVNVTVNLVDTVDGIIDNGDDNVVDATSSDAVGHYNFSEIIPGDYYIEVDIPTAFAPTLQDAGDDATDSDVDATGRSPVITLSAGDYNRTVDAGLDFAVLDLVVDNASVTLPEGSTATFNVQLSAEPFDDVTIEVTVDSGDTDITVQSGATLTFTPMNWDQNQPMTLAAAEDEGDVDDGAAIIRLSQATDGGSNRVNDATVNATEADNDIFVTAPVGDERWPLNVSREITWSAPAHVANVRIELARNGTDFNETIELTVPNTGSYDWTVSGNAAPAAKIQISDADNSTALGQSAAFEIFDAQPRLRHYVDRDKTDGRNDGENWDDAFLDLQEALFVAGDGDEIWVADGIYQPAPAGGSRTDSFQLKDGVAIYGGFIGSETAVDQRNVSGNETFLSGDLNGDDQPGFVTNGENSYHVVDGSGTDTTAVIDGFIITAGNADGPDIDGRGAGMLVDSGSPTVLNCRFIGNSAAIDGGGLYTSLSSAIVTNCILSGNSARNGGGVFCTTLQPVSVMADGTDPQPAFTNCTITGNAASALGGGIYFLHGDPVIRNTIVWNNAAVTFGDQVIVTNTATWTACNIQGSGGGAAWNPYFGKNNFGNIDSDPLFVDSDGADNIAGNVDDDFRLQAGSPCINTGTAAGSPVTDSAGTMRPQGATADIGAYEFADPGQTFSIAGNTIYGGSLSGDLIVHAFPTPDFSGTPILISSSMSTDYSLPTLFPGTYFLLAFIDVNGSGDFDLAEPRGTIGPIALTADQMGMDITLADTPTRLYVKHDAPGDENGLSWAHAFTDLQDALAVALAGQEIWVSAGVYKPTTTTDRAAFFPMTAGVSMYGGFAGSETMLDERVVAPTLPAAAADSYFVSKTVLSGDVGATLSQGAFLVISGASNAIFDGLTIEAGQRVDLYSPAPHVAGISNAGVSPTITRCVFVSSGGYSIQNTGASPTITDCTFVPNAGSSGNGGGMVNKNASPVVTRCRFIDNTRSDVFEAPAMHSYYDSAPSISDCLFSGNTMTGDSVTSGAVYFGYSGGSTVAIDDCVFRNNSTSVHGGALFFSRTALAQISDCVFDSNSVDRIGGAVYSFASVLNVTNCVWSGNTAGEQGGALGIEASALTATNCTIMGNSADQGGAIFTSVSPTFANTIFWGNTAVTSDPIVLNLDSEPAEFRSCNVQGSGGSGTQFWVGNNFDDGDGNIDADPLFINAADPDGFDDAFATSDDGLRLTAGSLSINTGDADSAPETDILGTSRPIDGGVDMGAYEGTVGVTLMVQTAFSELPLGVTRTFTWASDFAGPFDIEISRDGGAFEPIASDLSTATGSFDWTVAPPTANNVVIRIVEVGTAAVVDELPAFAIVDRPERWYVDVNVGGGANSGTSWDNAYIDLQNALRDAQSGEDIWVADGTYRPTNQSGQFVVSADDVVERSKSFVLKNGVGLYGGFDGGIGGETSLGERVRSSGGAAHSVFLHEAILSGDLNDDDQSNFVDNVENSYQVLVAGADVASAELDGVTVTGGHANNDDIARTGAGLWSSGATISIRNCTFAGNKANSQGGGIWSDNLSEVLNCTFIGNVADSGGGVYNQGVSTSTAYINCIFVNNIGQSSGGAISNNTVTTPIFLHCVIASNFSRFGGGMFDQGGGEPTVVNSIFRENQATDAGHQIYNDMGAGTPAFLHCVVQGSRDSGSWDTDLGTDLGGNIDVDPLFEDAVGGDFHLSEFSPCVNAGTNTLESSATDLDDNPRIQAGLADIGAYEYPVAGATVLDDLVVVSHENGNATVSIFDTVAGAFDTSVAVGSDASRSVAVARSPDAVLITNNFKNQINVLDDPDFATDTVYQVGTGNSRGICVDPEGNIWVGHYAAHQVRKLDAAGTIIGGPFNVGANPVGLAADRFGHIWIANEGDNTVVKLLPDGTVAAGPVTVGAAPQYVAIDHDGNIWVTNRDDDTVSRLDAAGDVTGTFDTGDGTGGADDGPTGIAVDLYGHVWISNTNSDTVTKLDTAGNDLLGGPIAVGDQPRGIACDSSGNVWVVCSGSETVFRLDQNGAQAPPGGLATGISPHSFGDLAGLVFETTVFDFSTPTKPGTPDAGATLTSTETLTFTWASAADADSGVVDYQIQIDAIEGPGESIDTVTGGAASFEFATVHGTTYIARVRGINRSGVEGPWSDDSAEVVVDTMGPTLDSRTPAGDCVTETLFFLTIDLIDDRGGAAVDKVASTANGNLVVRRNGQELIRNTHWSVDLNPPGGDAGTFEINFGPQVPGLHEVEFTAFDDAGASRLIAFAIFVDDGSAPHVVDVSSDAANGVFGLASDILVNVIFSEFVTVTGDPDLHLELAVGDPLAQAEFVGGSGTDTLAFRYTVGAGHNTGDLDYTGTDALILVGGGIADLCGNGAVPDLPVPGEAGDPRSLGENRDYIIDTVAPVIDTLDVTSSNPFRMHNPGLTADGGTVFFNSLAGEGAGQTLTVAATWTDANKDRFEGGPAFGDTPGADTDADAGWLVAYSVEADAGNQDDIQFTVTDATESTDAAMIDFVADNAVTDVQVIAPNGTEVWGGESMRQITWTASDDESGIANILIEFSTDGQEWQPIAEDETNDGAFEWTVPELSSETVRVRVTATDNVGNTLFDESDGTFEITTDLVVHHVDIGASPGMNGQSWATAFDDLQDALAVAVAGEQIRVAAGTYRPAAIGSGLRGASFVMPADVQIYGGFLGDEDQVSQRDVVANRTILSGDIERDDQGAFGNNADNAFHVVTADTGIGGDAVLDGFTIVGGNANDDGPENSGGGLFIESASPTIRNCVIENNAGTFAAGADFFSASPRIENCFFVGNSASLATGAISVANGASPEVVNCVIAGNVSGGSGIGAIDIAGAGITITNCTIAGNTTTGNGGGLVTSDSSTLTISNTIIWGNSDGNGTATDDQILDLDGNANLILEDSLVDGGFAGARIIMDDPAFANSGLPAGVDGQLGTDDDGFQLQPGSPAIDRGNANAVIFPATDILGNGRHDDAGVVNAGPLGTDISDLGAYERQSDSSIGLVVSTTQVDVSEGRVGEASFQVKLAAQPFDTVTLSVTPDGDPHISIDTGASLMFDTTNWDDFQTVTLTATEDGDTADGEADVNIVKSAGVNDIVPETVVATEIDDDINLTVANDGNGTTDPSGLQVIDTDPLLPTDISATPNAGFDFDQWSESIMGIVDDPDAADTTVTTTADATVTANFTATPLTFVVEADPIGVGEGGSSVLRVTLSGQPAETITATVMFDGTFAGGDSDLSVSGSDTVTFTTTNWNDFAAHEVEIAAAEDDNDAENGQARFLIQKIGGINAITEAAVIADEIDDDVSVTFGVTGQGQIEHNAAVVSGPELIDTNSELPYAVEAVSNSGFSFVGWTPDQVTINPPDAPMTSITAVTDQPASLTANFLPLRAFVTGPDPNPVPEGDSVTINVRLDAEPLDTVTASVNFDDTSGERFVLTSAATLTFTTTDWDDDHAVTVLAVEDDGDTADNAVVVTIAQTGGSNLINDHEVFVASDDDDISLTINAAGNGATDPSGTLIVDSEPSPDGDMPVKVEVTPDPGHGFINWSENVGDPDISLDAGTGLYCVTADEDAVITAEFGELPSITVNCTSSGWALTDPADIGVEATATDGDGAIAHVVFQITPNPFAGGDGTITDSSGQGDVFAAVWAGVSEGSYTITAIAVDDDGLSVTSDPIPIEVEPFVFEFVTPGPDQAPVAPNQTFTFNWNGDNPLPCHQENDDDICSSGFELVRFNLYVHESPTITSAEITSGAALQLNNTGPLENGEFDQCESWQRNPAVQTPLPIRDGSPTSTWFIHARVISGSHAGEIYSSDFPLTVTERVECAVIVTDPEPESDAPDLEMVYGESISVSATISPIVAGIENDTVEFRFRRPGASEPCATCVETEVPNAATGQVTEMFLPDRADDEDPWLVDIVHLISDELEECSKLADFLVLPAEPGIDLFEVGTLLTGNELELTGRFKLLNGNPGGVDLSDNTIAITVQDPQFNDVLTVPAVPVSADGSFAVTIDQATFDNEGDWRVRASFAGNTNVNTLDVDSEIPVRVRSKLGYAILVQGAIGPAPGAEGLSEHGNTLDYARDVLHSEGKNLDQADICYIRAGDFVPDHLNTPPVPTGPKNALNNAITIWAKNKMLANPAPLYIILVNHGNFDKFHMFPDTLSPSELDGMLTTLESALSEPATGNPLAADEPITIVLGMCFSGSFINPLSRSDRTRILLSASAPQELSIRGPGDAGSRHGEYFVYLLFRELSRQRSLFDSYITSRDIIQEVSQRFDLKRSVNVAAPIPFRFPGQTGQHPLIDDPADLAADLIPVNPTNDPVSTLVVSNVNQTLFLSPQAGSPVGQIFAEVDEDPNMTSVARMFMEVKTLSSGTEAASDSMQAALDLVDQSMLQDQNPGGGSVISDRVHYVWPELGNPGTDTTVFDEQGVYQIFIYAEETGEAGAAPLQSEPAVTYVYRMASNFVEVNSVALLAPENDAQIDFNVGADMDGEIDDTAIWSWAEATYVEDKEGPGGFQYIVRIWEDDGRETVLFESEPLTPRFFVVTPAILPEIRDYWWDVVAVDSAGNFSENQSNELRKVRVVAVNDAGVFIAGDVKDIDTGEFITTANVIIPGSENNFTVNQPVNGTYLARLQPGTYQIRVEAVGYQTVIRDGVVAVSGASRDDEDFALVPLNRTLEVTSSPTGVEVVGDHGDTTDFTVLLATGTAVDLEAPLHHPSSNDPNGPDFDFVRWRLGVPGQVPVDQPDGLRTLSFDLDFSSTADALYAGTQRDLTVTASKSVGGDLTGVPISGTFSNNSTEFVTTVDDDTDVTLTVPVSFNDGAQDYTFVTWEVDGSDASMGAATLMLNMNADHVVEAVYVLADAPPIALCADITVSLDAVGDAVVDPLSVDGGSSDDTAIVDRQLDEDTFACGDIGGNIVVLTVTDGAAQTGTCTATVTVIDDRAPVVSNCPATLSIAADQAGGVAVLTDIAGTLAATDNCTMPGALAFDQIPEAGTQLPADSETQVTITVTDASDNDDACVVTVTVPDLADLSGSAFDATPDHVVLGETTVSYTIANTGEGPAGAFTVTFVLSDDAVIETNATIDKVLGTIEIGGLAGNATISDTAVLDLAPLIPDMSARALIDDPVSLPVDTVSTSFDYIGMIIDLANAVPESDESNNRDVAKGMDKDDITFFPWDMNPSDGEVTPTDAIFVINRLQTFSPPSEARADINGNGSVSSTDAIAVINRIGRKINPAVTESSGSTAPPPSHEPESDSK